MSERYVTISLPESFVKKIDEVIDNKDFGYSSRAEFVKESIRNRLRELGIQI